MRNNPKSIISGGQTGADRAALDIALDMGIEIGGYVPIGRLAEDGPIPERYYGMVETDSDDPAVRTELNVAASDATLIFSHGELRGGSRETADLACRHAKPLLHIDLNKLDVDSAAEMIEEWLSRDDYRVLNIAGPRASDDPEIYDDVTVVLKRLLQTD